MTYYKVKEGDPLPDFELPSTSGNHLTKENILGKNVFLFIYPKDNTSSCTIESQGFSENIEEFYKKGVKIFGVSKDNIPSHNKFITKYSLNIELLSDGDLKFIRAIGAWTEKTMYGKKYMGVERTSILVSDQGKILKIWRKVRVPGHVQEVLLNIEQNI